MSVNYKSSKCDAMLVTRSGWKSQEAAAPKRVIVMRWLLARGLPLTEENVAKHRKDALDAHLYTKGAI